MASFHIFEHRRERQSVLILPEDGFALPLEPLATNDGRERHLVLSLMGVVERGGRVYNPNPNPAPLKEVPFVVLVGKRDDLDTIATGLPSAVRQRHEYL